MATLILDAIKQATVVDKSFNLKSSALNGFLNVLAGAPATASTAQGGGQTSPLTPILLASAQEELDKIPHAKAEKYRSVLQLVVDREPDLCYTGVKSYEARELPPHAGTHFTPGWAKYSSARFYVKA